MATTTQDPVPNATIGRKLKAARMARRLSLRQLAMLSDVPFYTIHKAERGEEIVMSSLIKLCKTLKISLP